MIPLLSPVKWHGGKFFLRTHILNTINIYFEEHNRYVELFAGGISVLLAKRKVKKEIINDVHPDLMQFYIALRDKYYDLIEIIDEFDYNRESFEQSKGYNYKEGVERSAYFFINNRLSFMGMGETFSLDTREAGGMLRKSNAYINCIKDLKKVSERLGDVEILNLDFKEVLNRYINEDTLFYIDPPYLKESRLTKRDVYDYEMGYDRHKELLELIVDSGEDSKFIINHYYSSFYEEKLKNLICFQVEYHDNTNNKTNRRAIEYFWIKK